jgi:hypothetical protein
LAQYKNLNDDHQTLSNFSKHSLRLRSVPFSKRDGSVSKNGPNLVNFPVLPWKPWKPWTPDPGIKLLGLMAILAFHATGEDSMGPHQFQLHLVILRQRPQTEGAEGMGRIWSSWRDNLLRLVKDCKKHEYFSRIIEKPSMDACEVLNLQVNSYMVYSACVTVKQTGLSIDCCEGVN